MRAEDFLDAVGQIDDELIDEALKPAAKGHRYKYMRLIPAAAAAVLVIAGTIFLTHISGGGGTATIVSQQDADGNVSGNKEETVQETAGRLYLTDSEGTDPAFTADISFEEKTDEENAWYISVSVLYDTERVDPETLIVTAEADEAYGTLEYLEETGTDDELTVRYIFRGKLPEEGVLLGNIHIAGTTPDGEEISQDMDLESCG